MKSGGFYRGTLIHIIILYDYYYIIIIFAWDTTIWKSGIWGCKKKFILRKSTFTFVQIKFLEMHITNQKVFMKFVKFLYI